jgi:cellulose synthase/poly-beta-1,6-N-acetylglucosamine synthase-like glycosyltransferase
LFPLEKVAIATFYFNDYSNPFFGEIIFLIYKFIKCKNKMEIDLIDYLCRIILISAVAVFSLRTALFLLGNKRENTINDNIIKSNELPFISVIVPARNEEKNIGFCINSISENDYPKSKYEIIVVNDRSTDSTGSALEKLQKIYSNLRVITIAGEARYPNLKGKPGALQSGFDEAKGSIILMTDADCTVANTWISSMVQQYTNPSVALVASFTDVATRSMFDKFQAIEWTYMHTMARGGLGINQPLGCYGNNLSIRRSVLEEIGGYKNIRFSVTEDLALLQEVSRRKYITVYLRSPESLVTTQPCSSLKEYLRQRHRWAIGGMDLGLKAVYFVLTSTLIWLGLLVSVLILNPYWFLAILAIRLAGDSFLIETSLKKLKHQRYMKLILPADITFMLLELLAPFFLLKRNVNWKEQIFSKKSK